MFAKHIHRLKDGLQRTIWFRNQGSSEATVEQQLGGVLQSDATVPRFPKVARVSTRTSVMHIVEANFANPKFLCGSLRCLRS